MNISRLNHFMTMPSVVPGYYAKRGMRVSNVMAGVGTSVEMLVEDVKGETLYLFDEKSKMKFKIPFKEMKSKTIFEIKE